MFRYFLLFSRTAPINQNGHLPGNAVGKDGTSEEGKDEHEMNGFLFGMQAFGIWEC